MSRVEDRLRDAYLGAADTVTPGSIRDLDVPMTRRSRRAGAASRGGRLLVPLAAAAAVTAIVVLATMVLPHASGHGPDEGGPATVPAAEPKFLIADTTGRSLLQVRNAATGALVAQITLPTEPGSQAPTGDPAQDGRTYIGSVATADGHHYLVSLYRLHDCRSWLYQFQLNDQGQPTALTPFTALPTTESQLLGLTFSGNGQMIAYTTSACMGAKPQPTYVAVTNIVTGRTTRWTIPADSAVDNVSLTANGGLLCYSLQLNPSVVGIIPTSAAPGSAADRGRIVVRAAQLGRSQWISFAGISPDGRQVYFTTYPEPPTDPWVGQVRVLDLANGRSRVVYAPAGQPGLIAADPSVRHLLLQIQSRGTSPLKLARLDLAAGTITYLPASWIPSLGADITW